MYNTKSLIFNGEGYYMNDSGALKPAPVLTTNYAFSAGAWATTYESPTIKTNEQKGLLIFDLKV